MTQQQAKWWQGGIIYQVYPRSFQDSNGDGVGDLKGILQRLDYLQQLGVTAVWLSPIYASPMADFGYDISDYLSIHPLFGTMEDFDELLSEVHNRQMKMILDLVPNHTSDEHPWFMESRSSRNNPRRDWYLWHDPGPDGAVPNNWLSAFGGSAWEWDEATRQYYYHAFLKKQPDLNWRNPEVQEAMFNVMRFWLDKGVDGFRVDVMWHMIKDSQWRDNPPNADYQPSMPAYQQVLPVYSTDQPEVHDIIARMRRVLDSYEDRMMIGEIYLPINRLVMYYGSEGQGAHMPFNFLLLSLPWDAIHISAAINEYEAALPVNAWPNWVLGNHDQPRITSRIGIEQSRVAAMLLLTLRGTPTIYYGEEINMRNVPVPAEEMRDPQGLNMPDKHLSRDPERTPMQWDGSVNAGFTTGKPWLPVARDYQRNNVAVQEQDENSMLNLYKRIIALRQWSPSLVTGNYIPVFADIQILSYIRSAEGHRRFLVVLNLSHMPCRFEAPQPDCSGTIVLATDKALEGMETNGVIDLGGDEGLVIALKT